ncbi:MAG: hypothetical protein QNJ22_17040 [Desulfosarcinaceae bacterium]|nr:hypothetical protein [Desulfosarcinaceae bacterium]
MIPFLRSSTHTRLGTLLLTLLLIWTPPAAGGDDTVDAASPPAPPVPGSVEDSFAYMAELATHPAQWAPLEMARLTPIIDYLLAHRSSGRELHRLPQVAAMPGAYHSFTIGRPLSEILTYAYNPEIPQVTFRPTSIRLTYWSEINGQPDAAFPRLWPLLSQIDTPHQLRGREVTEITPDLFSGAYFQYRMDTRLILMENRGHRIFLAISKQPERSAVGRKGAIVGGDHTWNYLYAASAGLAKPGLGWVKSYIYDSISVMIYLEPEAGQDHIEVGVFKWLKAGWAGMNMVKAQHIHEGLLRFAGPFKQLLESPNLPAPERLASYLRPIMEMPVEELRLLAHRYHQRLRNQYADQPPFNNTKQAKLFGDPQYADKMDRIQMVAMLTKDYIKPILGRESLMAPPSTVDGRATDD